MDAVGGVNHENTPCRLGVFPGSTRRRRSTKHPTGICKSSSLSCRKECTRYLLPEGGRCVGRICAQTSELFRPFFYAQVPPTPAPGQAPGQAPLPSDAPARIQLTQRQYRHVVYAARQPAHCMGRWTSVIPRFGRKVGPPEAVPDGGSRRRRLLAQTRACCHGLPRPALGACHPRFSLKPCRSCAAVQCWPKSRPSRSCARWRQQEAALARPDARMLPRASPRPAAGACHPRFSLLCPRPSRHRACRGEGLNSACRGRQAASVANVHTSA